MFKKALKRAFTIVELVVVIAVIAALAAVLIPTFVNVIDSANNSADQQAVKNMNTALIADENLNGPPKDPKTAMEIIEDAGYTVKDYVALKNENTIYYDSLNNRVLIWTTDSNGGSVTYPSDMVEYYSGAYAIAANWYLLSDAYETAYVTASDISTELSTLSDGDSVILQLTNDIDLTTSSSGTIFSSSVASQVTVDLDGHTLTISGVTSSDNRTNLTNGASLYFKNGTIEVDPGTSSIDGNAAEFKVNEGCSLTLENVVYYASGSALFPAGTAAQINIINSTIIAEGNYGLATNASTISNYGVYANVTGSTIESESGCGICWNTGSTLNISDSIVKGVYQGLFVRAGTATVTDSTISSSISANTSDIATYASYTNGTSDWGSGYAVALGAVVVGNNKNAGYNANAVLTMSGCTLSSEITDDTNSTYSAYEISLYVIQGSAAGYTTTVTVSGCTMNNYVINYNSSATLSYSGTVYTKWGNGWSA